ncbi:MAG: hypothetical protein BZY87_03740 [SAR202 cluster bacterium Io17-Chloro-G6]|nr:MAG: hypothetical protein BZY87_03740 [SAR202 cluster bacterium Io17-Chloro-G6]
MTPDQIEVNGWIDALDQREEQLSQYRGQLDQDYPNWKAKFDLDHTDRGYHDARREYFQNLSVILQNVRLSFIFMRDQILDPAWWNSIGVKHSAVQTVETLYGYQTMARQYSLKETASIAEQTLTSIAFSGHGQFELTSSDGLANVSGYVLRRTSVSKDYKIQFHVLSQLRNTIHSNGTFSPKKGGNTSVEYGGTTFTFDVGKPVGYDNSMMVYMFGWISEAMWKIVTSPQVSSIPHCRVYQPQSEPKE